MLCCWFSTPPERSSEWRAEMRHFELWGKLAEQVFRTTFSGAKFMSPILVFPLIYKCSKILHGEICSLWLAVVFIRLVEIFCKKYVFDCMYSPFSKTTYTLTFHPTSLEQFLRAICNTVSQAIFLILPQIKFYSWLSCAFFFKLTAVFF